MKLPLLHITNLIYTVLSTLVLYFGSEVCFETNVSIHTYHALVLIVEQFLKI